MIEDIKQDARQRMQKSLQNLATALQKLRTGRAHTSLLDHIKVDYYGSETPLNQVAAVTTSDARTLTVTPWEKNMVPVVEKALLTSDLGLTPSTAGTVIRLNLPPLTEERRKDLVKVVKQEGEQAKIAIRNIRRDALGDVKDLVKEKLISEDDEHRAQDQMQHLTDEQIQRVDEQVERKSSELMEM